MQLINGDQESVKKHLALFHKELLEFQFKTKAFGNFARNSSNFAQKVNDGWLQDGTRRAGVKTNSLPLSIWQNDNTKFGIPWVGSQIRQGRKNHWIQSLSVDR